MHSPVLASYVLVKSVYYHTCKLDEGCKHTVSKRLEQMTLWVSTSDAKAILTAHRESSLASPCHIFFCDLYNANRHVSRFRTLFERSYCRVCLCSGLRCG